jgi:hypothetical protein
MALKFWHLGYKYTHKNCPINGIYSPEKINYNQHISTKNMLGTVRLVAYLRVTISARTFLEVAIQQMVLVSRYQSWATEAMKL